MKSPAGRLGQRTEEPRGCRGMGLAVRLGLRKSNIDTGSTSYKRTQCGLFAAVLVRPRSRNLRFHAGTSSRRLWSIMELLPHSRFLIGRQGCRGDEGCRPICLQRLNGISRFGVARRQQDHFMALIGSLKPAFPLKGSKVMASASRAGTAPGYVAGSS